MVVLVGVTGGIACGKSTVSQRLHSEYRMHIIDADRIVHQLQAPGTSCFNKIAKKWPEVISTAGELNRAALGQIVFSDPSSRRELGRIMNREIFLAILKAIFWAWWKDLKSSCCFWKRRKASDIVILDAPTLFETRWFVPFVSNTLVVSCSTDLQRKRLLSRPHPHHPERFLSEREVEERINSQMPLDQKKALAGYVLENNNDMNVLDGEVDRSVKWMTKQSVWRLHFLFGIPLTVCLSVVLAVALKVASALMFP